MARPILGISRRSSGAWPRTRSPPLRSPSAPTRWAAPCMPCTDAARFWSRLVRWASRSETDDLQVTVSTQGDAATVTADAVTAEGTPREGLDVQASVGGPVQAQIPLVQTASGRYEARVQLGVPGAYALAVTARDAS